MGYPSPGAPSILNENPITEVERFLDSHHPQRYKVYNLCQKHAYDPGYFHGRVEHCPIEVLNVPPVKQIVDFVRSVRSWFEADAGNVVAVHCRGCKGRTGMMASVLLVEAGLLQNVSESITYVKNNGKREQKTFCRRAFEVVATPSQLRYVSYFEQLKLTGETPITEPDLHLTKIHLSGIFNDQKNFDTEVVVEVYSATQKSSVITSFTTLQGSENENGATNARFLPEKALIELAFVNPTTVKGDVRIAIKHRQEAKGTVDALYYFWFHSGFILDCQFKITHDDLDFLYKKPSTTDFFNNLTVDVLFTKRAELL